MNTSKKNILFAIRSGSDIFTFDNNGSYSWYEHLETYDINELLGLYPCMTIENGIRLQSNIEKMIRIINGNNPNINLDINLDINLNTNLNAKQLFSISHDSKTYILCVNGIIVFNDTNINKTKNVINCSSITYDNLANLSYNLNIIRF